MGVRLKKHDKERTRRKSRHTYKEKRRKKTKKNTRETTVEKKANQTQCERVLFLKVFNYFDMTLKGYICNTDEGT